MPEINDLTGGEAQIRRRKKLSGHTTAISNILIFGYNQLSDAAKMTYIALESYDWPDENGFSKGKAWPSIATLAADRGKSYDTISRHLKELQSVGLITVESGKQFGRTNVYWLEEPSEAAVAAYTARCQKRSAIGESFSTSSEKVENPTKTQTMAVESNQRTNTDNAVETKSSNLTLHNARTVVKSASEEVPQNCSSGFRKFAVEGESFLPDKGIQPNQIKPNQEKDFSSRAYETRVISKQNFESKFKPTHDEAANATTPSNAPNFDVVKAKQDSSSALSPSQNQHAKNQQGFNSSYVSRVMQDFSLALHDSDHININQNQVNKLFRQAGMSEQKFVECMYEAKKRTQWAALAGQANSCETPNRAAYFFVTLRRLLEERNSGLEQL